MLSYVLIDIYVYVNMTNQDALINNGTDTVKL